MAELHELPDDISRTQIYDRVVRDLLGLPLNGTGVLNEQRADELLPLLAEVAFTFFQDNAGRKPMTTKRILDLIAASPQRPAPLGLTSDRAAN